MINKIGLSIVLAALTFFLGLKIGEQRSSSQEETRSYNLGQLYSFEVDSDKSYEELAELDRTVKIIDKRIFNYQDKMCYTIIVEGRDGKRASFFVLGTDPYIIRMYNHLIVGDRVMYKAQSGPVKQPNLIRQ